MFSSSRIHQEQIRNVRSEPESTLPDAQGRFLCFRHYHNQYHRENDRNQVALSRSSARDPRGCRHPPPCGAPGAVPACRRWIFCIRKRRASAFPAGKSRRYNMSMKKRKTEKILTPKSEKSPVPSARQRSRSRPESLGRSVGALLVKVKTYFAPAKTAEA